MVTDAQNLLNLGSASRLTMQAIHHRQDGWDSEDAYPETLDQIPKSAWSQTDRLAYLQSLAAKIQQYPSDFNAETLSYAATLSGANFDGMFLDDFISTAPDGSASLQKVFADTLIDTNLGIAGDVASIGQSALNLTKKLASTASNIGDAADKLSSVAGGSALGTIGIAAVLLIGALLLVRAEGKLSSKFA